MGLEAVNGGANGIESQMVAVKRASPHSGVEPKIWENPQIIHLNGVFHYKPSILGTPSFGNIHSQIPG